MKSILIAASMMALATPAFAQMTGSSPASPPASTDVPPSSAPSAESAAPAPAHAAAPATDPKAIIASEFPIYDKDGNGSLARAEFDTWLTALKEKSGDTSMKSADKTSWLKTAFTTADKDKSKGVSLAELTEYLTAAG